MKKEIETIEIVSVENRGGVDYYVVNPEWEEKLYNGSVSELNITHLINEGHLDPTNGLKVSTKHNIWRPYLCDVTKMWAYRR